MSESPSPERAARARTDSGKWKEVEAELEAVTIKAVDNINPAEYEALREKPWLPEKIKHITDPEQYRFVVGQFVRQVRHARFRDLREGLRNGDLETSDIHIPFERFVEDYQDSSEDLTRIAELQYFRKEEFKRRKELARETRQSVFGGILNKKGIQEKFDRGEYTDSTIAFVRLDLDGFKAINDSYSHEVGDMALQAFAESLKETTRSTDDPIHFSGDEYGIVMKFDMAKIRDAGKEPHEVIADIIARTEAKAMLRLQELYKEANDGKELYSGLGMSTGFVIAEPGEKDFSKLSEQADEAVEVSKLLGQTKEHPESKLRVVPFSNKDAIVKAKEAEIVELSLRRNLKRGAEAYAKLINKDAEEVLSNLVDCILKK